MNPARSHHSGQHLPRLSSIFKKATRHWLASLAFLPVVLAIASPTAAPGQTHYTTPYSFTTFAGSGVTASGGADGTGSAASFITPTGVTVDAGGNVFVADTNNHKIRKITPAGVVTTFAGTGVPGGLDGSATAACFNGPTGIVVDPGGNFFVADTRSHKIRKITPAGVVTTFAGSGSAGSADGTGTAASFNSPAGVTLDPSGNLYVADAVNRKIRKITPAGVVTTFAGSGTYGSTNGTGTAASFSTLFGLTVDSGGNLFAADQDNNRIRKITPAGVVTTFAGSGTSGSTDGTGTAATFSYPSSVVVDGAGNLWVADKNSSKIRKITAAGVVTTFAGSGSSVSTDGTGVAANFAKPAGIALDASGNLFVADEESHRIRKVTPAAVVTTLAGANMAQYGTGTAASFSSPEGIAVDTTGNVFIAERSNHKIRKITAAGVVTTFAGSGAIGSADGTGTAASFREPGAIAIHTDGNVFVADTWNSKIRKITPAGVVTTFAGSGSQGNSNGTGTAASFRIPEGIAVDASGNVFVADTQNHMIRKITPAGVVTTFAGSTISGNEDGTGTAARFYNPKGLAIDPAGNLFVADASNYKIRKITPAGVVTTLAGSEYSMGIDGPAEIASFQGLTGVAADAEGNVFVTDSVWGGHHKIRKISPAGVVSTVAGSDDSGFANGIGAAALFWAPEGVAVDAAGNLFVADTANHRIRKGVPSTLSPQRIDFAPLSPKSSFDPSFAIGASASSGLPVTFSIFSGPATLSGDTVTLTGPGTVVVCATQPGSTSFEAAPPVYQSFTVSAAASPAYHSYEITTLLDPVPIPSLALDADNNLLVGAYNSNLIRKITPDGTTSTFTTATGITGIPSLAMDASGNAFVAAYTRIYKVTPAGVVTTLAGAGSQGNSNGIGTGATFWDARDLAVDASGNVFVLDRYNSNIRKITPAGVVTTFAGSGERGSMDGTGRAASFREPQGLAIDAADNLFVADTGNHKIRKVTPAGVVTTLAGSRTQGSVDGTGSAATFKEPRGVTVDASGNVFVGDGGNHKIRKITPWGEVTTLAGTGVAGSTNGTRHVASFNYPADMAVDASGNLFIADSSNNKIRKAVPITGAILSQAITFGAVQDRTTNDTFVALSASASSSLPVEFTIVSGPAFITGSVVTLTGPGTVTVRASQAGNEFHSPATPVEQSFTVSEQTESAPTVLTTSMRAGSGLQPFGNADGPGEAAGFNNPNDVALDAAGNLFVADMNNHKIRKITPAGVVTTFAGSGTQGNTDATGTAASFNSPRGVAVDSSGNVFVADWGNHKIRKITPAGVVTTFAGTGSGSNADGSGTAAGFNGPSGVGVDAADNVFVADSYGHKIRKITPAGLVSTLAGSGTAGSTDANGLSARFNYPTGVAVDAGGNVFVADWGNNKIRKITPTAGVTTFAGSGAQGSADGTGTAATFSSPQDLAFDPSGNLIVADRLNHRIRKITPGAVVTTIAGSNATGSVDATGAAASFNEPTGVAVDGSGNIFVADTWNHKIRKITPAAVVTTVAGIDMAQDGSGAAANFYNPAGVAMDANGNAFVADTYNHKIRKITPAGVVTTFAGSGSPGSADGTGTAASFNYPGSVAVDASGNVFVADTSSHKIRKITPAGVVTTFAGSGNPGLMDGTGTAAGFSFPAGVATDIYGNVFVADYRRIRKITPGGVVTTFAGTGGQGSADGPGSTASFRAPAGLTVDMGGNVFVADREDSKIRQISPAGVVTTLAGSGLQGSADGTGAAATFRNPCGVAVDSRGVVFVADTGNHKIRKITRDGVVTTIAGLATAGNADGTGTVASFNQPKGIAVDAGGNLIVADTGNHRIRMGLFGLQQTIAFDALPDKDAGDSPFALSATASSGLPVAFTIVSGPATVAGVTLTLTGPGTVVVRASQPGDATYAPAPAVDRSFTVAGNSDPEGALNNWATASGLTGEDATPEATPFDDGVPNLLKFAFNMNAGGPDISVLDAGGTTGLPLVTVDQTEAEPVLKVEFLRRKGSGLIYTPQRSDTLDGFVSMTGNQTVTSINAEWERVTVEETAPPSTTATSGFARVQVTLP